MLDLSNIPVRSSDRDESHPLIIAGGPVVYNPEPMADFIDAFVIGDGEEVINEILDMMASNDRSRDRLGLLKELAQIEGVYVPRFYDIRYSGLSVSSFSADAGVPDRIVPRRVRDLESVPFPDEVIVPLVDTVHDRAMVELLGWRGCRFCQAGII